MNKLSLGLTAAIALSLAHIPAHAQAPAGPVTTSALPIALPPGATVQVEVDGRDQDLLGVVKSLLTGATSPGGAGTGPIQIPGFGTLTDEQITGLIKNIHHLHFLSFTQGGGTDALAFYEQPYIAEGGHRLVFTNMVPRMLMVGFDQPGGFALVVQSPEAVYVARADGYPDMQLVGRLMRVYGNREYAPSPTATLDHPKHVPATKARAHIKHTGA